MHASIANDSVVHRLTTGTFVVLSGTWKACPPGKEQSHELHIKKVEVLGLANAEVRRILMPSNIIVTVQL